MSPQRSKNIHATALSIGGNAVLLAGRSGAGKSDLALRCLSMTVSALVEAPFQLVSDDQSIISLQDGNLIVAPPHTIAGRLEVRGVGIVDVPFVSVARVCLIARLTDAAVERHPGLHPSSEVLLGRSVRAIDLRPFEVSAPIKLALSLQDAVAAMVLE